MLKSALILLCIISLIPFSKGKAYALKYFGIERPRLGLELSFEYEKEERRGPFINREDTTMTFTERVDVETRGWIYHPALAIYRLRLSPEWEQETEETESGDKKTSDTFLQGYFAEVTILQYKPYSLRLFAEREQSTLNTNFTGRTKKETDTYGATFMLKYRMLPTTLSYRRMESTQTGFSESDEKRDEYFLNMRYDQNLGKSELELSYIDSDQTTEGTFVNTKQQRAFLQNIYDFSENKTLTSSIHYNNTKSTFNEIKGYIFTENFLWRHRKNLTTFYNLRYETTDFEDISRDLTSLYFNLTHLLYENFTTTFDTEGSLTEYHEEKELDYGARLNFIYKRRIPWGSFRINIGHRYKITNRDVTTDFAQIIDEPVTLTTGVITLLSREHVDTSSIVVTDNTGIFVYFEGLDYRITEIDTSARISRIPGGAIIDGQGVLVDYRSLTNPAFDYSVFNQNYGINFHLWSVWRIYYSFNRSKQTFLSGVQPDRLTDDTIHIAGTDLNWKWSRTSFEYEDRDTTNVPTRTWRALEALSFKPYKSLAFGASGNYGESTFKDTGEIEKFYGLKSYIQWSPIRQSRLAIEGFYDTISGRAVDTENIGASALLEWYYGIWRGSLRYKYLNEDDRITNETLKNHYLLFEIKRTLF